MTNELGIKGPAIISEATLRTRDLAPAFLNALYLLGDDAAHKADKIRSEYHDVFVAIQTLDSIAGDVRGDNAEYLMETLFDALDEFAPEGTYFGSSEGDGACFGFWQVEEEFEISVHMTVRARNRKEAADIVEKWIDAQMSDEIFPSYSITGEDV